MQYQILVWFKRVVRYCNYLYNWFSLPSEDKIIETLPEDTNLYSFLEKLAEYLKVNFSYASDNIDFAKHPLIFAKEREGDCDDYALFSLWSIRLKFPQAESYIATCYTDDKQGHAVCLVKFGDKYYHIGNWGLYGGYSDLEGVASSIYPKWQRFYVMNYNFTVLMGKRKG